ncbi:MAG: N-acetylmuramic acid 6-phosphate etherase [Marinosulfonomonas sp.]|nr:N-acetylmuramic acid 6-phosphate etherase [Marinosulfonomonas sp.]
MALPLTEAVLTGVSSIDTMPDAAVLARVLAGQKAALAALDAAMVPIAQAAAMMADAIRGEGRLIYAAAGSSALMAVADGLELGGTFGISPDRISLMMAGGLPTDAMMPGHTEDDVDEARVAAQGICSGDVVIAVTASGNTAYAIEISRLAKAAGARTIGIANNANAPLFETSDVVIYLPTPPEVIAGSTRLGAATAQKAALNMMSTLMGVHLGHVHDGMMVNLVADNAKLRARAVVMVCTITGVDAARAQDCLARTGGAVKPAVLLAAGIKEVTQAEAMLGRAGGILRAALTEHGFYDRQLNQGRKT